MSGMPHMRWQRLCFHRRLFPLTFCFIGLLTHHPDSHSQAKNEIEYRLKAVYLLNFLQFTEWPDTVFEDDYSPIILGILGEDRIRPYMEETVESEKVGNHPIVIEQFRSPDEISTCHALFVGSLEKDEVDLFLSRIGHFPILLVSDNDGFADAGGSIGFYVEKNKIRFAVNLRAVHRANLKVSSKLLRLAKIVDPP
jgi:hypothetical protein